MGLIKAAMGAVGGTLADQWKEFIYCDSIDVDTLVVKGQKRIGSRSSNTKGSDNIITNGSGIVVADGQCMIIVDNGKVVEICADPGEFTYDTSTEPSIFSGKLGTSIVDTFKTIGKRFAMGGDTGHDQRVYYFNTKEIHNNMFGTANPIPFRVVDSKIGLDIDVSLRCSGIYSYRISNPILFYTNVCGNVSSYYDRKELDSTLKTEFISALQPALGKLSELELRPSQVMSHTGELEDALNSVLDQKWGSTRGIEVVSVSLGSVTVPDDQQEMITSAQRNATAALAGSTIVAAQAQAMKDAANNAAGAMNGFMGVNMAQGMGGMNAASLYQMAGNQQAQPQASADSWKCSCGAVNTGKFCAECGQPKPAPTGSWKCSCGAVNTGKFCAECGQPKPASDTWVCSCGATNTGKFCADCGKPRA